MKIQKETRWKVKLRFPSDFNFACQGPKMEENHRNEINENTHENNRTFPRVPHSLSKVPKCRKTTKMKITGNTNEHDLNISLSCFICAFQGPKTKENQQDEKKHDSKKNTKILEALTFLLSGPELRFAEGSTRVPPRFHLCTGQATSQAKPAVRYDWWLESVVCFPGEITCAYCCPASKNEEKLTKCLAFTDPPQLTFS